jgi:hypothetical protein
MGGWHSESGLVNRMCDSNDVVVCGGHVTHCMRDRNC